MTSKDKELEKKERNEKFDKLLSAMLFDMYNIPQPMPEDLVKARIEKLENKQKNDNELER